MKWNDVVVLSLLVVLGLTANFFPSQAHVPGRSPVNKTVLLNNDSHLVPLTGLDQRKIAVLLPIEGGLEPFADQLDRYAEIQRFYWSDGALEGTSLDEALKYYNTLFFAIPDDWADDKLLLEFIKIQAASKDVLIWFHGPGQNLYRFDKTAAIPLLWTREGDVQSQRYAAMSIFGGLGCTARLESDYSDRYHKGAGTSTAQIRLCYAGTDHTTVNTKMLERAIDGIMTEAIYAQATPGGVIMVVQDGHVLFEKAYGYHTYKNRQPTRTSDIFDLASITKIVATTPAVMQLAEQGVLDLDHTIGHYLWQAIPTDKAEIKLRKVLLHEAGLTPYIPFYRELGPDDLRPDSSASHGVKVADQRFVRNGYYEEVMWPAMLESPLHSPGEYKYSDLSMYIMKEIVEHRTAVPFEQYLQRAFYGPLGMYTAGFNPRKRFAKERIVPTEDDRHFRGVMLQGYVHDQGAALAGGVAGHAGLFATANDLAIYGQMLLNRGRYGDEQYFEPGTVDLFTSRQSASSRRGLGFDRYDPRAGARYPSGMASEATFGHTGYTGTAMWIDPEKRLVFIFLSNRVHPQVNGKLRDLAIRRRLLDVVYVGLR